MKNAAHLFPPMPRLLELAGFRVWGRRADCVRCQGRSRRTVSFTSEVAYCHRCQWTANQITLASELGLLSRDSRVRVAVRLELERRERLEAPIREFEKWRDIELHRATCEYRCLSRCAAVAASVLKKYPDCEPAWNALAIYYHRQATLAGELDRLSCAKFSDYLEAPYSITVLFCQWRTHVA